ncbi:hypothetical protein ACSLPA_33190, partial [Escherichia coli]
MLHPQDAVLIFFKTGHQYPLKALHHPFTLSRWQEELLWKLVKGRILYPSLTALCVTGGIFLASWGLIQWQESR